MAIGLIKAFSAYSLVSGLNCIRLECSKIAIKTNEILAKTPDLEYLRGRSVGRKEKTPHKSEGLNLVCIESLV